MKFAIDRQSDQEIAEVNVGAGQAIGGYQRGATERRSGADRIIVWNLELTDRFYVGPQVDVAGQIRFAGGSR